MDKDNELERFVFQKFREVMEKGEADPTDHLALAWLYRDDCWESDNKPKKSASVLAWCVGIDLKDEDATPINSPRDLMHYIRPELWMEGTIRIRSIEDLKDRR